MRTTVFPDAIRVRLDPDLRANLLKLAQVEKSTISEVARRALRRALAEKPERQERAA